MTLDAGKWRREEDGIKKYLNKIRNIIIISSRQRQTLICLTIITLISLDRKTFNRKTALKVFSSAPRLKSKRVQVQAAVQDERTEILIYNQSFIFEKIFCKKNEKENLRAMINRSDFSSARCK